MSFRKKIVGLIIWLLTILLSTSCGSYKRVVYFQGEDQYSITTPSSYTPVFKKDDYLSVTVMADDPETAEPFNYPNQKGGNQQMMMQGGGGGMGPPNIGGYLIDQEGYIDLPVIGKIKAEGKSRTQLVAELKNIYKAYLSNPTVDILIRNFRVTILGDVGSPGIIQVTSDRISIIDAIGVAGDLNITGQRDNILVIRERDGIKKEYRIDFTSKEVYTSPVFYLEQNDVVYVEPSVVARTEGAFWRTVLPSVLGLASLALTTILLITN